MAAGKPIPNLDSEAVGERSRILDAIKIALLVAFAAGCSWLLWAHREWFEDPQLIKSQVVQWGAWGPVVYMVLYAIGPSFLVPGAVMTIAAGLAFGTWWGSLWSLLGADIGAVVAFAAGRIMGREFVVRAIGSRFRLLLERIARNGFYITLYLRIVPVIPYNAFNLLAGASPITFRDYFWASMIGMVPGTILFAFLGDALWHPTSPRFFLAVGLIVICFAAGEIYRRYSKIDFTS